MSEVPQVQGRTDIYLTRTKERGGLSAATTAHTVTSGDYTYTITPADLHQEQRAFETGKGVCN